MKSRTSSVWLQLGVTFVVSLILLVTTLWKAGIHDEQDKSLSHRLILLLISLVMSLLGIALCYATGLPIRLSGKIRNWWQKHIYLQLFLIIVGCILLILSLQFPFAEYCKCGILISPNEWMFTSGWLLIIFIVLHFSITRTKEQLTVDA